MPKEHTPEEIRKLLAKLPEELKETLFAEATSDTIYGSCERYGISEEKAAEVSKFVGDVLIGLLPPNEFQGALEKELNLDSETAKKVAREITRYVFFPVKASLEELYKIEVTPAGTTATPTSTARPEARMVERPRVQPTEKEEKTGADVYRESLEE